MFCNHRESAERIGTYLRGMKVYAEVYHGGMEQEERERALYKFRNGSCPVLVSTDLAARGLDIPEIRNVVHYHLPVSADSLYTATDAQHVGKLKAMLMSSFIVRSSCPDTWTGRWKCLSSLNDCPNLRCLAS